MVLSLLLYEHEIEYADSTSNWDNTLDHMLILSDVNYTTEMKGNEVDGGNISRYAAANRVNAVTGSLYDLEISRSSNQK